MSVPTPGQSSPAHAANNVAADPFVSPDFHVRMRSLSSTSDASATSSTAHSCSDVSALRRPRSGQQWPRSDFRVQFLRMRTIPLRWLAVLLCLTTTFLVWRWPPPSTKVFTIHIDRQFSTSASGVLRPYDSAGSSQTDFEQWLKENSEDALPRNTMWWRSPPPKPRAAIISLVRNEELQGIMQSMRQLEQHWNRKYQYPWVFFNEKPFSDEFKVPNRGFCL